MQKIFYVFFLCLVIGYTPRAIAQKIELTKVEIEDRRNDFDLFIKLLKNGKPDTETTANSFIIEEIMDSTEVVQLSILEFEDSIEIRKVDVSEEIFDVFFLVDRTLNQQDLVKAKSLITEVVSTYTLSDASNYHLATFTDQEPSEWQKLSMANLDTKLTNQLRPIKKKADVYKAIFRKLQGFEDYNHKKLLFLITSGQSKKLTSTDYTLGDVQKRLKKYDNKLYVLPVGLGDVNEKVLKALPNASVQENDAYQKQSLPDILPSILTSSTEYVYTKKITVQPNPKKLDYIGRDRTYVIKYKNDLARKASKTVKKGSLESPIILEPFDNLYLVAYLILGLLVVIGLLGIFVILTPMLLKKQFLQNFVQPFTKDAKSRVMDPLTGQFIQPGELVVSKCNKVVSLDTWKDVGWQCPSYPDCMYHQDCAGAGAPEGKQSFFDMQGVYKKLNWLWFGVIGGFLGWLFFATVNFFGFDGYKNLLSSMYGLYGKVDHKGAAIPDLRDVANDTIVGVIFSIGLIFMLAWIEERGQSREISWLRILLRTFIGAILSFFIFMSGLFLQFYDLTGPILSSAIKWVLFGIMVGSVLSIKSTIQLSQGIKGGLLAGIVAFAIHFGLIKLIAQDDLAKLISLLTMGGLLGWILVAVVESLEEYELEFIAPSKYRRIVPISKWLRQNIDLNIGKAKGSYIYIKWDDPAAAERHATLIQEDNNVYLLPHADTLVGRTLVPSGKKKRLQHGDIIQLGRESTTKLRFIAKKIPVKPIPVAARKSDATTNTKAKLDLGLKKRQN